MGWNTSSCSPTHGIHATPILLANLRPGHTLESGEEKIGNTIYQLGSRFVGRVLRRACLDVKAEKSLIVAKRSFYTLPQSKLRILFGWRRHASYCAIFPPLFEILSANSYISMGSLGRIGLVLTVCTGKVCGPLLSCPHASFALFLVFFLMNTPLVLVPCSLSF